MATAPSIGPTGATATVALPAADVTRDLYERFGRQIFTYCYMQLGNREDAEDAVQNTFLNAFRGLGRGVELEFESAWLYKIAENVCLTKRRAWSRRRRVERPEDLDAIQDVIGAPPKDAEELMGLRNALKSLPEQQRQAIQRRQPARQRGRQLQQPPRGVRHLVGVAWRACVGETLWVL